MSKRVVEEWEKETHFLNVDLDIYSKSPLDNLIAALGESIHVLFVGKRDKHYFAILEEAGFDHSETGRYPIDADRTINKLIALVNKLPKDARKIWNKASVKEFNIGIQAGYGKRIHEVRLKTKTLKAVTEMGGNILVWTYPVGIKQKGKSSKKKR